MVPSPHKATRASAERSLRAKAARGVISHRSTHHELGESDPAVTSGAHDSHNSGPGQLRESRKITAAAGNAMQHHTDSSFASSPCVPDHALRWMRHRDLTEPINRAQPWPNSIYLGHALVFAQQEESTACYDQSKRRARRKASTSYITSTRYSSKTQEQKQITK